MTNQLIFVADGDPKNLQILKENLEASGFRIQIATDGDKAWEDIQRILPDIVLSEINLPGINGFQLLEKLKSYPNTSFIPLIFLTNQREVQLRVQSFQLGAKDYMVKPLHVKEVIAHIRMVQRRLQKRKFTSDNNFPQFSGKLNELSVANLIETFSLERKTGVLTINNGNSRTGQIYFRDGTIVNATLGDMSLEKAVYQMLPWKKGFFNMVFHEVDIPDEISVSNLGLLLEGIKRMEQRDELSKKLPPLNTVVTIEPSYRKLISRKNLPEDVITFLTLIDGKRTLEKIIEYSPFDDVKTFERLLRLYSQGFIKPLKPALAVHPHKLLNNAEPDYIEDTQDDDDLSLDQQLAEEDNVAIRKDELTPIFERIEKQQAEIILPEEVAKPTSTDDVPPSFVKYDVASTTDISDAHDELVADDELIDNTHDEIPQADEADTSGSEAEIEPSFDSSASKITEPIQAEAEESAESFTAEHEEITSLADVPSVVPNEDENLEVVKSEESYLSPAIKSEEPKAALTELTSPPEGNDEQPAIGKQRISPIFNKEEFLKKQRSKIKLTETAPSPGKSTQEIKTPAPHATNKRQILAIGFDDDSLDEVMDILTSNAFQTKELEAIGKLKFHFGKVAINDFTDFTLFGISGDDKFNQLIKGLSNNLVGIIFIIESSRTNNWEYVSYLIHSIRDTYQLHYSLAVTNLHEQNSVTLENVRYKLNLSAGTSMFAWDAVDTQTIKDLLSSIVDEPPENSVDSSDKVESIVENVSL